MSTDLMRKDISSLNVLVADDDKMMRKMIEYALKAMGIQNVTLVCDGMHALQVLETPGTTFDLIICDWMMPKMDGMEFLRQVRTRKIFTQFLMLTGKATTEAVSAAVGAGANSYIVKPFAVEEFHKKIRMLINNIEP